MTTWKTTRRIEDGYEIKCQSRMTSDGGEAWVLVDDGLVSTHHAIADTRLGAARKAMAAARRNAWMPDPAEEVDHDVA